MLAETSKSTQFLNDKTLKISWMKAKDKSLSYACITVKPSKRGINIVLFRGNKHNPPSQSGRPRVTTIQGVIWMRKLVSHPRFYHRWQFPFSLCRKKWKLFKLYKLWNKSIHRQIIGYIHSKNAKMWRKAFLQWRNKYATLNWNWQHISYNVEWV